MSRSRRSPLDARSPAGRMPARLLAGIGALVIACGGFAAYRALGAVDDAYRWTGESEAVTVARGFARSLSPGDLRDPAWPACIPTSPAPRSAPAAGRARRATPAAVGRPS